MIKKFLYIHSYILPRIINISSLKMVNLKLLILSTGSLKICVLCFVDQKKS